jgi:hypothetical protein
MAGVLPAPPLGFSLAGAKSVPRGHEMGEGTGRANYHLATLPIRGGG